MRSIRVGCLICLSLFLLPAGSFSAEPGADGLLFSLSGDTPGDGFTADVANGDPEPAYLYEYTIIPDGFKGKAFSGPHSEEKLMAYLAPGNIYAERGTVSFFWRSRDPVGKMPFKIFYVSACDQASLDMTWLRVDYNGKGFEGFVTDADMARIRVAYNPASFPAPGTWTHIALSWDETQGVKLFMGGALVAHKDTTGIFSSGLGLFTPHGRFSNPGTVTSNCGHLRGGDIDEIAIYDRMLDDEQVKRLARGDSPGSMGPLVRTMDNPRWRDEWWLRNGWNDPGNIPPYLDETCWTVRKVEIHDAYDQKKWVWRSNDGIRETSWPNIYNRSSLLGRSDYFIEPDWYCYSTSGKAITYTLPEEPWNYCELTGAAFGSATRVILDRERQTEREEPLFSRPQGRERTFHLSARPFVGGKIRFENKVRETPLAEFQVYNVAPGFEPTGVHTMTYTLTAHQPPRENHSIGDLLKWIRKRYPADERQVMLAMPERAPRAEERFETANPMPLVHIIVPCEFRDEGARTSENAYGGFNYELVNLPYALDGIAIDLPALAVRPTHGEYYPLNIQVKDPIWPNRNMLDFSFSVKQGEAKTLWLDTRDRVLPERKSLYLTIAGAGGDFGPAALEGARLRLVFKPREKAIPEQEIDRFTQARDNLAGNLSETRPQRTKLEWYARYRADMEDLFRVSPNHELGRFYWNWYSPETGTMPFEQPRPTAGVPLWAFRQTEVLKQWKYFLNWWIDNRQIDNGEMGGGLSDDGDFANCMPPIALMGVNTDKITDSMHRLMDAYYANGMFTNGLCTIVTDALHVSEEGTNVQSELMLLEYGDPKLVERIMQTAARYPDITGVNAAGHRHFPSRFYSSTFQATENPWCWSSPYNYTILHPGMALVEFNGNPTTLQIIKEVGDGYLAHGRKDENGRIVIPREINYITDEGRFEDPGAFSELFRVLHRWTGDQTYAAWGRSTAPVTRTTVDKDRIANNYAATIQYNAQRMYIGTEGFPWDDGPYITPGGLMVDRLGGPVISRGNQTLQQAVSWRFDTLHGAENAAILVPQPSPTSLRVIVYNLSKDPISAVMTGWDVEPGIWEVTEGIDSDGDDSPDGDVRTRTVPFGRTEDVSFTFPPRQTQVIEMTLREPGTPYRTRPELGIGRDDVKLTNGNVQVTVHNLGSVQSPAAVVALVDTAGTVLARAAVPAIAAPVDLKPRTARVSLKIPGRTALEGCRVVIDPERKMEEITRDNNEKIIMNYE